MKIVCFENVERSSSEMREEGKEGGCDWLSSVNPGEVQMRISGRRATRWDQSVSMTR